MLIRNSPIILLAVSGSVLTWLSCIRICFITNAHPKHNSATIFLTLSTGENNVGDLLHLAAGAPLLESGPLSAPALKAALDAFSTGLPARAWPAFSLNASPAERSAARSADMVDALNMLTLVLPGTPLPLFGEELGRFLSDPDSIRITPDPDRYST
jgi:hypothetical protein